MDAIPYLIAGIAGFAVAALVVAVVGMRKGVHDEPPPAPPPPPPPEG